MEIVQKIVGYDLGEIVPINLQSKKHDTLLKNVSFRELSVDGRL